MNHILAISGLILISGPFSCSAQGVPPPGMPLDICPNLFRLKPSIQLLDPWRDHIFAFLVQFCFTSGDRFDTEGNGFATFMKRTDIPPTIGTEYNTLTLGGTQKLSAKTIEEWCKRPELLPLLNRRVEMNPILVDLWNNYNVYDTKTILDKLPDVDTTTTYGPDLICRVTSRIFHPCPVRSTCGELANVTLLPEYLVTIFRNFCDLIVNDVELNDDPFWRSSYHFDDFLNDCQSKSFYEGLRCLPYNKTVKGKLKKHLVVLRNNSANSQVGHHMDRIFGSFRQQIRELFNELRSKFNVPFVKLGGDCTGSLDYQETKTRIVNYIMSPADGTFPFREISQTEGGHNVIFREIEVVELLRDSCDFYGDIYCDSSCKCKCPPGGDCVPKDIVRNGSVFTHPFTLSWISTLILQFILVNTSL